MNNSSVNSKIKSEAVATNLLWRFAERCGAQGVSFIVSIVLARLLTPDDYGLVAIVTVIISILNVFIDSGMGSSLIQKKDTDDLDFSSVFYFNVFFCLVIYAGLFICAPLLATIYKNDNLTPIIRVVGLTIVISGLKNIQMSYVSKTMQFKKFFFATLGGTISAAIIGIVMAVNGFGVWALVAQHLLNTLIDTIILWFNVKWRPKLMFSIKRLKSLFSYGWKLLASNLLDNIYNNMRQLVIGIMYASTDLAFYNKGKSFPWLVIENINSSINSVLLPTMSSEQNNIYRIRDMVRRSIKVSIYIMAPIMMGFFFIASPFIELLLTEKWLPCIPFLRIFCITYMFYPIHTANINAILALGRSDVFLKLEIIKKVMGLVILLISMPFGVMAMAYSLLATTILSMIINSWPNKKLINYNFICQLKDMLPNILLAVFMGICVWTISLLNLSNILTLLIQGILGVLIYVSGSIIFKVDSFYYILGIIKPKLKRGSKN